MAVLEVRVKPNARDNRLEQQADGSWLAHVKALPVDGKANDALIRLVASHFGLRRAQVSIKSGGSGRIKRLVVDND
ncbi:MAG TPA: DUF167 domain-containing protein [Pseudomonadales bacterium]